MDNATMHSLEHMFATYVRNSEVSDKVVYFGPMGCQTGFYLLVRDLEPKEVFELTKKVLRQTIEHEGVVFGKSAIEFLLICAWNHTYNTKARGDLVADEF